MITSTNFGISTHVGHPWPLTADTGFGIYIGICMAVGTGIGIESAQGIGICIGTGMGFGIGTCMGVGIGIGIEIAQGIGIRMATGMGLGIGTGIAAVLATPQLQPQPSHDPVQCSCTNAHANAPAQPWLNI